MFSNIGGKIKGFAKVICIIGIVASVIGGLGTMIGAANAGGGAGLVVAGIISGLVLILVGSLFSWIGSFFTYGFGELVENSSTIARLMAKADTKKSFYE